MRWSSLADQLGTAVLSFALALIVWMIAVNTVNPVLQREFETPIPITVRGLDGTLQPVQDISNRTAKVTVRGPEASLDGLTADDFNVYVDLTDREVGEQDVDVQVTILDSKVQPLGTQPDQLRVQLDAVVSKDLGVQATVMDSTAYGYYAQTPLLEPLTVTVSGPSTQVAQVTNARVEVYLNGAKSQVDRVVPVLLTNSQGQAVPRVQADPANVRVVVPVEQTPGRKEVAVRPNLTGEPNTGYRLSSVQVSPSTIVLIGNSETLAQVPGFVETAEVSLANADADIEKRVDLVLPDGVTAMEGATVLITAEVTPIEGGSTLSQAPIVQGLAPGLEANVSIDEVEVILSGPVPMLDSLEPDDMFVILDLTGLVPGSHSVRPRVLLPEGIEEQGVLPETVEVIIVAMDGVTPVPPGTIPATGGPGAAPTPQPGAGTLQSITPTPNGTHTVTPTPDISEP